MKLLKRQRVSTIAIDAGPASVVVCQLSADGDGRPRLLQHALLQDSLRSRPLETEFESRAIDRTRRILRQTQFIGGLTGVALRPPAMNFYPFTLPEALGRAPRAELLPPLRLEAARQLQVDPATIEVDYWELPTRTRRGVAVMIAAMRRETVARLERFVEGIGLVLSRIEALPCALIRAAWLAGAPCTPGAPPAADALWGVLDLGFTGAMLTLALGPTCVYVRPLNLSGDGVTIALMDALEVDYTTAETLKRRCAGQAASASTAPLDPDLVQVVQNTIRSMTRPLADEVERSFSYAIEACPSATLAGLYLTGGSARLTAVAGVLRDVLEMEVRPLEFSADCAANLSGVDGTMYAAAVGAALCDLDAREDPP